MLAREIIGRAGGLMPVTGLFDPGYGFSENIVGYGTRLAQRYENTCGLQTGECFIIISNSGKNASPIEVALHAKTRGLTTIALTALSMSTTSKTVHPGGKNLHEICDHTLDNGGVPGDAVVEVEPGRFAGPTSTLTGSQGHSLPLVTSQNIPGGMEANIALAARYRTRLSKLIG
jgi:uncharacterized phosphosugar-binding protein